MSRIDELINRYAPNGVQHKRLGDAGTLYNGLTGKSKADFSGGNARYASYMNVYTNVAVDVSPNDRVQVGEEERQNRVRYGDVLFTASSENVGEVGLASAVTEEPPAPLFLNSFCFGFRPSSTDLDPAFCKYLFRSAALRSQIVRTANGVTRINISKERFREIKIPVPHPQIQLEIVTILDAFTNLVAALEAELRARKQQYAHYRDALLAFDSSVARVTIDELTVSVASGRNKSRVDQGAYPVYGSTGRIGFTDTPAYSGDAILVARVGANAGRVAAVSSDYDVTDNTLVVSPSSRWSTRFAFHQLTHMNLNQYAVGGGQPLITGGLLKRLDVSLPSIDEQARIADVLDKFDALVNDSTSGLPAEIEMRRQQYAYYRDRLLTFEEAPA
ncbi:restriction endonuclease subunit S [Cellulomonas sp.]|uniref:restriction endonuclease subunit S n=1 Tax=Cellulomonas sp. TaxID=40001 RepID=UPI003BAD9A6E